MDRRISALAPPPRRIPLRVRAALRFGGALNQMGWFFVGFGMIFVWAFGAVSLAQEVMAGSYDGRARGRVVAVERTSASIDEEPVNAVRFEFEVDGARHEGTSHTTAGGFEAGQAVAVEYSSSDPSHARVEGLSATVFPWFVPLLCLIFPIVGVVLIALNRAKGRLAVRLMRDGILTVGTLAKKEPTNVEINDRPVYRLIFNFVARDGRSYSAETRTHLTEAMEDDREERILYDPASPRDAMPFDEWAGIVLVAPDGTLHARGFFTGVLPLVVPALTIFGHGGVLLFLLRLFR